MELQQLYRIRDVQKEEDNFFVNVELFRQNVIFKVHFPGNPILPGACIVDIVKCCAEKAMGRSLQISAIKNLKFLHIIQPDQVADLVVTLKFPNREEAILCKAVVSSNGNVYTKMDLSLKSHPKSSTVDYFKQQKIAVLIPTYNNSKTICQVIESVSDYCDDIIVVNDGSTDDTSSLLKQFSRINLVEYSVNKGKGNALKQGFLWAKKNGFKAVITMDSDGQHLASDLPLIAECNKKNPDSIVIGSRSFNAPNMPQKNSFANRFSNFWFTVQTAISLPDTQTGFRLYPLDVMGAMLPFNSRYEAELELLVRCAWKNIPIVSESIHVYYPPKEERVSHFRPGMDFFRISLLNTLLCILAIVYGYPSMLIRKLLGLRGSKFCK